MRIRVTDTAGHPLPYAGILVSVWTDQKKFRATQRYTCDEEGLVTVNLPKSLWILRLWAAKKGYSQEFYNFETNARVHELKIPDEFKFRMVKGTTLAGTVTNEEDRPIAGATVHCSYEGQGVDPDDPVVTDAQGRWKFEDLRPGAVMDVRATHLDYLGQDHGRQPDTWHKVTTFPGHTQMPPIVLRRGILRHGQSDRSCRKAGQRCRRPVGRQPVFPVHARCGDRCQGVGSASRAFGGSDASRRRGQRLDARHQENRDWPEDVAHRFSVATG